MSRIRRVGGKIEISVGGNYYIISGKDIITTAGGSITETAGEGITYGDASEEFPPRELKAKVAVHFRPHKNWKGEGYGFDWMRKGDYVNTEGKPFFGDTDYERLVSKQFKKKKKTLELEENTYSGDFEKDSKSFLKLKKEYSEYYHVPWRTQIVDGKEKKNNYHTPWLSLYPGANANLSLVLYVEEPAEFIYFKYDKEYFKLTPEKLELSSYKKQAYYHNLSNEISIECLKEFSNDQKIEVIASKNNQEELAGALNIWANDASKRKKLKVVFVEVLLPLISDKDSLRVNDINKQGEYLKKYFGQALIETEVLDTIELDIVDDKYLRNGGTGVKDGMLLESFVGEGGITTFIINYLQEKFEEKHKEVDKEAYIVFYIAEQGARVVNLGQVALKDAKIQEIDGVANKGNKAQVLFRANELDDWTTSHEIMHSIGLAHSFTNKEADANALYTFEAQRTENIMDYSLWDCYSLWKWQWEIINKNI